MERSNRDPERIIVVGGGVAGSEAGTYLGHHAEQAIDVIEVEHEPQRRFGGWGFQSFPDKVYTNLAIRKMYLGRDSADIFNWIADPRERAEWPRELQDFNIDADKPLPRALIQRYVAWRRQQVQNTLVNYLPVTGEAMKVIPNEDGVSLELGSGEVIDGDHLIMASGSISVKVPPFLRDFAGHERVIIDPLTSEGNRQREAIDEDARVLIVGMGLTGEEQAHLLLNRGLKDLTLLSRNGFRHFVYNEQQQNKELVLPAPPAFFKADSPEVFNCELRKFFDGYIEEGYTPEDILAAIRPHWEKIRKQVLGRCVKAANRLRHFQRPLAVYSIGTSYEISEHLSAAEKEGHLQFLAGHISTIKDRGEDFLVTYEDGREMIYDNIINAVGRNIIRHPIWKSLLTDGIALKHAGIGVQVNEHGQMLNADGEAWNNIWVLGMARAGDHTLRHGFLGNTAFNVPQVREHLYDTMDVLLRSINTGF